MADSTLIIGAVAAVIFQFEYFGWPILWADFKRGFFPAYFVTSLTALCGAMVGVLFNIFFFGGGKHWPL